MRRLALVCPLFASILAGQTAPKQTDTASLVPDSQKFTRIVAVVPMVGTGKADDPIRPMFVMTPSDLQKVAARSDGRPPGIHASHYQLSDDGKSAIVEFLETDRATLAPLLKSTESSGQSLRAGSKH